MRLISFKKYIAILLAIWLVIVIAGLIFSRSIQSKIIGILSEQTSKHLTTEIHVRKNDIHFSIFKKFPLASIELRNATVKIPVTVNLQQSKLIKGDTLLHAKSLFLQLDLKSLLSKNYKLERIHVKHGFIHVVTDAQGNSSINILRKKETNDSVNFAADIGSFVVSDLTFYTSDKKNNVITETYLKDASASGKFTKDNFLVNLKSEGKFIKYMAKNQVSERNNPFSIDTEIEYSNKRYTIKRGGFKFSNIPFKVIGSVTPGRNTLVDLLFSAKSVPLKQIDKSLLHGILGPTGLAPKSGYLDITSTITGYTKLGMPSIKANYTIRKGKMYDSKRKMTYESIYVEGNADNGRLHLPASTTIRIDSFNFIIGNSQQWGKLKISNMTNPRLSIKSKGFIDILDIKPLVEIPDIQFVEGTMRNNLAFAGILGKSGGKGIDKLEIWGDLVVNELGLVLENYKIPYVVVSGDVQMQKDFSLTFNGLSAKSGHSDVTVNGRLFHVIRKDGIARFEGNVSSNYFFADDFVTPASSKNKKSKPVDFPDSLIINGNVALEEFTFGKFSAQNIKGNFTYASNKMELKRFAMNGFDGTLKGNLSIRQDRNDKNITMVTDAHVSNVDIEKLFDGCNNFSQEVIGSKHLGGSISGDIDFTSVWTDRLQIVKDKISNISDVVIENGELVNYQPLMGLSNFIDVEELKHIKFDKLATTISIKNEVVMLDQTEISSSAITFDGSGMHGFDNKYEYHLQLGLSDLLWKKAKKKKKEVTEFGYIVDDGVGHTILPLIISGKGTSFNVKYDRKQSRKNIKEKLKEEKKELKELFKSNNKAEEVKNDTLIFKVEHETRKKPVLQKTDSGKYKVQTKEHTVIWDDSEDEDGN